MAQKVALITAGTAGLGAQIARVLAPDFRIAINYANNQQRAKDLITELEGIPSKHQNVQQPRFQSFQADVGDKPAIQRMVRATVSAFGRLDVVISNAGWTRITNFSNFEEGLEDEDWDRCFLYNVKAHLWLMAAAKEHLESTEGAFVTTASIAGVKPSGSSLPYAVTKAASIHLSKCLAVICSPKIRVNSVAPGLLLTEWGMKFPESKREAAKNATKLKRLATVEVSLMIYCYGELLKTSTGRGGAGAYPGFEPIDDWSEYRSGWWKLSLNGARPVLFARRDDVRNTLRRKLHNGAEAKPLKRQHSNLFEVGDFPRHASSATATLCNEALHMGHRSSGQVFCIRINQVGVVPNSQDYVARKKMDDHTAL
ncbi:hypothetical protein AC579_8142 [Pseudocercospora musae]|uniref:Ketoreductase (KR) domain-containing protein n=1 Tax=Pseudocercospora musae TaxID=113226 RepID=A0A139IV30_9PEZI|nr:hypothetical protein AC579_8142 [Pseudocercospora musae]